MVEGSKALTGEAGDVHARETRLKGVDHGGGVHPLASFETFQPRLRDLLIGHGIWTKLLIGGFNWILRRQIRQMLLG